MGSYLGVTIGRSRKASALGQVPNFLELRNCLRTWHISLTNDQSLNFKSHIRAAVRVELAKKLQLWKIGRQIGGLEGLTASCTRTRMDLTPEGGYLQQQSKYSAFRPTSTRIAITSVGYLRSFPAMDLTPTAPPSRSYGRYHRLVQSLPRSPNRGWYMALLKGDKASCLDHISQGEFLSRTVSPMKASVYARTVQYRRAS